MSEKIEKCVEGHEATCPEPWRSEGKYLVRCTKCECWLGPTHSTRAEAISAWNEVMRAVRMQREQQDNGAGQEDEQKPVSH